MISIFRRLISELGLSPMKSKEANYGNARLPAPMVLPPPNATPAEFAEALTATVRRLYFCATHPEYSADEDKTMNDFHPLLRVSYPNQSVLWDYLMRYHIGLVTEIQRLNYRYACEHEVIGSNDLIRLMAGAFNISFFRLCFPLFCCSYYLIVL